MLADFAASASSFLPNMMFPNNASLGGLGANFLDSSSLSNFSAASVNGSGSSEPIYIAISTNPLILLPFCFNSATNSLVPMAGATGANGVAGGVAGKGTAPIIFPNGLPSGNNGEQQNHQQTSPPSPSGHSNGSNSAASSSSSPSPSLTNNRSNHQTMPFITTFSNLTQHLMNNNQTSQTSQNKKQTTSALINSLINAELASGVSIKQQGKVF